MANTKSTVAELVTAIHANPAAFIAALCEQRNTTTAIDWQAKCARNVAFIGARLFSDGVTKETLAAYEKLLATDGFGCNASQLRQKLAKMENPDKSKRFPGLQKDSAVEAAASTLWDDLDLGNAE
jgi:hypothetical protein